jgi:hypothetical protein
MDENDLCIACAHERKEGILFDFYLDDVPT